MVELNGHKCTKKTEYIKTHKKADKKATFVLIVTDETHAANTRFSVI